MFRGLPANPLCDAPLPLRATYRVLRYDSSAMRGVNISQGQVRHDPHSLHQLWHLIWFIPVTLTASLCDPAFVEHRVLPFESGDGRERGNGVDGLSRKQPVADVSNHLLGGHG